LLTFTATANQTLKLKLTSITTTPAGKSIAVTVFKPNGSVLTTASASGSLTLTLSRLAAGTYSVLLVPDVAATASMQATISTN
jgi:hypothetical protein